MADIEKIRVKDRLRIEVEVSEVISGAYPVRVEGVAAGPVYLWRPVVEAAEHIPAPKVFKRGDWVRTNYVESPGVKNHRHGLVLSNWNDVSCDVSWPDAGRIGTYPVLDLEHDEAPE